MSITIDLTGRTVLVTGAAGGIGSGIARRFHAAGATVAIHHRTAIAAAAALAAELPGAVVVQGDLLDETAPAALVETVVDLTGRLDVVVNNAGVQPTSALADVGDAAWDEMIGTNLTAVHRLSREAIRHMPDGGAIVHIASIEGFQPAFHHGHYNVAKAGLIMHARAAALEWGPRGVRVNVVSPGLIHRDGIEEAWPEGVARWRAAAPLERLGTPEDIGDACVFLASDLAPWITGANLVVDGGVTTHPNW